MVYDACALYGNAVRDLLIRVGRVRLVQPKWTHRILDELDRALARRPAATEAKRRRLRALMLQAVADCVVTDFEPLIEGLKLPDADDRHVLAAAIKSGAEVIVTSNIADFPADALSPWGVVAKSPDAFLLDLIDVADKVVFSCVQQIVDQRVNPPETLDEVLRQLERGGLVETVAALRFG